MKRALIAVLVALGMFAQEAPAPQPAPAPNVEEEFTRAVFFGKKFADLGEYVSAQEQYAKADALKPDQSAVLYNHAVVLAQTQPTEDQRLWLSSIVEGFLR